MAKIIRTVLGDIDPESLGLILPHEHLITFPPMRTRTDIDYRLPDVDKALEEVKLFKSSGGTLIAEMTTHGYGRDVRALRRISEETGVPIISTTGFIMESLFPNVAFNSTEEELVELFVHDITEGMDGTDIKAGWIKCGTSIDSMSRTEEKVMRAAAKAALKTGVSVTTHSMHGTMVFTQVDVLTSEGVPPNRICIGHLDRNTLNPGYVLKLARTGVYFAFDNVSKSKYFPDSLRIDLIKMVIEEGFIDQILLSMDCGRQSYLKSYGGWPGLGYIPENFIPMMRNAGISNEHIQQMTELNPRNFAAFEPR